MSRRLVLGQPARVLGMPCVLTVVGRVWRRGVRHYALRGLAGLWPSWLVESARTENSEDEIEFLMGARCDG
ncbi:hypothetical protein [Sphingopyxis sp.]|uniref:hypothetical protein n=1 Tax=Sphingopyxis sp. TaxID=1908224 RepID=UPI0025F233F5|nr:hypothetical protein [Sphingopyxis sp.]MBK6414082.1 hypothetical protein [Sphingopyxis sp.]